MPREDLRSHAGGHTANDVEEDFRDVLHTCAAISLDKSIPPKRRLREMWRDCASEVSQWGCSKYKIDWKFQISNFPIWKCKVANSSSKIVRFDEFNIITDGIYQISFEKRDCE